jgi:hypothetical protein
MCGARNVGEEGGVSEAVDVVEGEGAGEAEGVGEGGEDLGVVFWEGVSGGFVRVGRSWEKGQGRKSEGKGRYTKDGERLLPIVYDRWDICHVDCSVPSAQLSQLTPLISSINSRYKEESESISKMFDSVDTEQASWGKAEIRGQE